MSCSSAGGSASGSDARRSAEVAAERGVRQHQQGRARLPGVLDQGGDALQVEVQVAAEVAAAAAMRMGAT